MGLFGYRKGTFTVFNPVNTTPVQALRSKRWHDQEISAPDVRFQIFPSALVALFSRSMISYRLRIPSRTFLMRARGDTSAASLLPISASKCKFAQGHIVIQHSHSFLFYLTDPPSDLKALHL